MDQQALQLQNRPDFSAAPCTMRTSKKFFCTTSRPQDLLGLHSRDGTLNSVRCYSKKSGGAEVCKDDAVKKQKSCLPKKCNKITLKGCPPVRKNTVCKQKNLEVRTFGWNWIMQFVHFRIAPVFFMCWIVFIMNRRSVKTVVLVISKIFIANQFDLLWGIWTTGNGFFRHFVLYRLCKLWVLSTFPCKFSQDSVLVAPFHPKESL